MSSVWTKPWTWLPGFRRDEALLDGIVAAAKRRQSAIESFRSDALAAEAGAVRKIVATDVRLAMALALFAEATRRHLGWTPFDVQLRAAAAMALGFAVEMRTGEGKTLAVAAAAAAMSLQSRRVHVATVNQYLANRDYAQFISVFSALGITAGLLDDRQSLPEKRHTYEHAVVYGTGYAFGFDLLREQLRLLRISSAKPGQRLRRRLNGSLEEGSYQPPLDCTIVDELDAVLLDEATVPLVLNEEISTRCEDADILAHAAMVSDRLVLGDDFSADVSRRTVTLRDHVFQALSRRLPPGFRGRLQRPWRQYVECALTAAHLLRLDVDYIVADRKIWIVDTMTGRIFDDRRWSEGLQRAVEHREGVPYSHPSRSAAGITRQRFFKCYATLCGASGTLAEGRSELADVYDLKVCVIPPRLPSQFRGLPALCFRESSSRDQAAISEALAMRNADRPVLIGCRSIEVSKNLSQLLTAQGADHRVLNGTQSSEEAEIVTHAGQARSILVATNLAGRGTDIRLSDAAHRAGGLHVVGVEFHESFRIDRQLMGRSGRQGDPGSGRFFISADDSLWQTNRTMIDRIRRAARDDGELPTGLADEIARFRRDAEASAKRRRAEVASSDLLRDEALRTMDGS